MSYELDKEISDDDYEDFCEFDDYLNSLSDSEWERYYHLEIKRQLQMQSEIQKNQNSLSSAIQYLKKHMQINTNDPEPNYKNIENTKLYLYYISLENNKMINDQNLTSIKICNKSTITNTTEISDKKYYKMKKHIHLINIIKKNIKKINNTP